MSSTYSILCLSHDPAIEVTEDVPSREEALAWAADGFGDHPGCDLLVARYSGAIVEIGCPGAIGELGDGGQRGHSGWHRDPVWADAQLIRVAAAVVATEADRSDVVATALGRIRGCWTIQRLHRLRTVLEVTS